MRAIALLPISALYLSCGRVETVELTAKLVMSRVPGDWCGSGNPDNIRLDCPFDLGLYITDEAGKELQKVCVKMDKDPSATWATLPEALNQAAVRLEVKTEGSRRIELAAVEPGGTMCDYVESMANASFSGKSELIMLTGTEVPKRIDVNTKCLKAFTPTATCIK